MYIHSNSVRNWPLFGSRRPAAGEVKSCEVKRSGIWRGGGGRCRFLYMVGPVWLGGTLGALHFAEDLRDLGGGDEIGRATEGTEQLQYILI
jgi:hypothetical protein